MFSEMGKILSLDERMRDQKDCMKCPEQSLTSVEWLLLASITLVKLSESV